MRRSLVMACVSAGVLAVVCAGASKPVQAQSAQRLSVQASGLYIRLSGKAFDSLSNGVGGEVQFRYTNARLSYGVGIQYTKHNRNEELSSAISNTATLLGFFFEPRYTFDIGSASIAPYVSARLAYSRMSLDIDQTDYQATGSAPGQTINGGGGVLIRLNSRTNLDLGATFGYTKYDDVEYSASFPGGTQTLSFPLGSGKNLVVRVGLAFGLSN